MKTIIAGSRKGVGSNDLLDALSELPWTITSVVSGGADGADSLGEAWADIMKLPLEIFPADWKANKRAAGFIRNEKMLKESGAEALLALWDGQSHGTEHMIKIAARAGLLVHIFLTKPRPDVFQIIESECPTDVFPMR